MADDEKTTKTTKPVSDESGSEASVPDGKREGGDIPIDQWIPHPVSDSAEYLDGPAPRYISDLPEKEQVAARAAEAEMKKRRAGHVPRSESSGAAS